MTQTAWRKVCRAARLRNQKPSEFMRQSLEQKATEVLQSAAPETPAPQPQPAEAVAS